MYCVDGKMETIGKQRNGDVYPRLAGPDRRAATVDMRSAKYINAWWLAIYSQAFNGGSDRRAAKTVRLQFVFF